MNIAKNKFLKLIYKKKKINKMRYLKFFENFSINENELETKDLDGLLEPNVKGHSPLDIKLRKAIKQGDLQATEEALEEGADISARRFMAIRYALESKNLEILEFLLNQLTDEHFKSPSLNFLKDEESLQKFYSATPEELQLIKSIVGDKEFVDGKDDWFQKNYHKVDTKSQESKLLSKVIAGDIKGIEEELSKGAKVSDRRFVALKYAVQYGNMEVIKLLLNKMDREPSKLKYPTNIPDAKELELESWIESSDKTDENQKNQIRNLVKKYL